MSEMSGQEYYDHDDHDNNDNNDDRYIMIKCVFVCLSWKIITSHFRAKWAVDRLWPSDYDDEEDDDCDCDWARVVLCLWRRFYAWPVTEDEDFNTHCDGWDSKVRRNT